MPIKIVVYLDVLLFVNGVIAAFLLLGAGLLAGQCCNHFRLACASCVAALTTLILLAPELPFVLQLGYQVFTAVACVKIAYARLRLRAFLSVLAWYVLLNLLLAGGVTALLTQQRVEGVATNNLAVYFKISPTVLLLCVVGVYGVLRLVQHCFGAPMPAVPCEVCVSLLGAVFSVRAFCDTGCTLADAFSQRKILVLAFPSVEQRLPQAVAQAVTGFVQGGGDGWQMGCDTAVTQVHSMPLRFIDCTTVAGKQLLPAIAGARVWNVHTPQAVEEDVLLAFCNESAFPQDCDALFGTNLASVLMAEGAHCARMGGI